MPDPGVAPPLPPAQPASGQAPVASLLFAAGDTAGGQDPVVRFLVEDAPALDWRADFLRNDKVERLFDELKSGGARSPEDDHGEEEVMYSKSDLVTVGEFQNIEDSGGM